MYATLWNEGRKNQWYLAICLNSNVDGTFLMDHMHRVKKNCNNQWKLADLPDTCSVKVDQILPIKPNGHWNFTNFNLANSDFIRKECKEAEKAVD